MGKRTMTHDSIDPLPALRSYSSDLQ